jgi:hypothetical protein
MRKLFFLAVLVCFLCLPLITHATVTNLSNIQVTVDSYTTYFFGAGSSQIPSPTTEFKLGDGAADGKINTGGTEGYPFGPGLGLYGYFFSIEVYQSSQDPVTGFSVDFGSTPLFFDFGSGISGNSFWGFDVPLPPVSDPNNPPQSAFFDDVSKVASFSFTGLQPGQLSSWMILISDELKTNLASSFKVWSIGQGPGPAPVPEPATMVLLGLGLVGVAGYSRKKFNRF